MQKIHTKTGAASFYIVAFTTLLLSVIVVSFVTIILTEMARTANNDLSQSAYDSALAGVEDAKAAILNYQKCIAQGYTEQIPSASGPVTCPEIIYYINHPDFSGCDTVAHILSRIGKGESGEVLVEETTESSGGSKNNMQQAYTCVKTNSVLDDYRSNMTSASSSRVIQVHLENASVKDVKSIRLSWYSDKDGNTATKTLFSESGSNLLFPELQSNVIPVPPVISIQMLQTAENFTLEQFEQSVGNATNRGTLFLVPTTIQRTEGGHDNSNSSHIDVTSDNAITAAEGFVKSNDKTVKNVPYAVYCPENANTEFACSVSIEIPQPVGGERNEDTFIFVVSLPYQKPDTDFALEVCSDEVCSTESYSAQDEATNDKLQLKNVQTSIDSTGRANELYRRVEVRVEQKDIYFPYPEYAIQLLKGSGVSLDKNIITTHEGGE
ncbi:hypothetical protein IKX64_02080 [Candidatus Saccharibacteria bacterium]|nr:hypothetical protein [Candidatus Saccharibacteria bacterium]